MAEIDSLEIKLKSNAKDLSKDFDTLSNSLTKLSNIGSVKKLDSNLQNVAKSVKNFVNELNKIDTKSLDKVNHLMDSVAKSAIKGSNEISEVSKEINKTFSDTSNIKKTENALKSLEETSKKLTKENLLANYSPKKSEASTKIKQTQELLDKSGFKGSYGNNPELAEKYGNKIKASDLLKTTKEAEKIMDEVTSKANTFKSQFKPSQLMKGAVYTDEYKKLSKDILNAEKELQRYQTTQQKLDMNKAVGKDSARYRNVEINIQHTTEKLRGLYTEMNNLQTTGKDVINPNQFDKVSDGASKAQGVMLSLSKALRAGGFGGAASSVQKLGADVGSLSSGMAQLGASAEGASGAMAGMSAAIPVIGLILAAVMLLIKAFTSLAKAVINVTKKIIGAIKGVLTKIKEVVSSILSIGTASNQAHTMVGKFINKIVGLFKSRVLRQAITQAIQYMKDGFKSLDAYSNSIGSKFHTNVQTIIADMKWLGRTIATAFEPLANVAFPLLDKLINKIVTVINYINQFFSALTGSQTWTRAVKTASDYSSATSGAAKAQKDLNKQIREWDKLNVITDPNKNNGGGGSGSSGANGDGFVTEDVSNPIKNLAERIKESWDRDADFTWLGTEIASKVKDTLDGIQWDEKIKPAAAKFGKALATLINGFVEFPGLADTIGTTIAQAINTVLTSFDEFTKNIHGDSIGAFIGQLVGSALKNIEWNKYITGMGNLGEELAKGINALAETDVFSEITKAFAKILKGAIEGAYKFVTNLDFKELGKKVGKAITDFFKEMNEVDESGMSGWEKLGASLKSIGEGIEDFFKNLKDNVNTDEIKKSLGNFLKGLIDPEDLKDKFKEKLGEAFLKAVTAAPIDLGTLKFTFNAGESIGQNFINNLPTWEQVQGKITELATKIKNELSAKFGIKIPSFEEIRAAVEKLVSEIKAILSGTFELKVPSKKTIESKLKSVTSAIKSILKFTIKLSAPKWDSIKAGFNTIIDKIKSLFKLDLKFTANAKTQTISTTVGNAINNLVNKTTKKKANGGIYSHGTWQKFGVGGFPSHGSAFIAGESGAELVGHINGQTEVLNKSQIAQAMAGANAEQVALLRQQNELLMQILQKESGISYKDVFKATQKGNKEYKAINGVSAFA